MQGLVRWLLFSSSAVLTAGLEDFAVLFQLTTDIIDGPAQRHKNLAPTASAQTVSIVAIDEPQEQYPVLKHSSEKKRSKVEAPFRKSASSIISGLETKSVSKLLEPGARHYSVPETVVMAGWDITLTGIMLVMYALFAAASLPDFYNFIQENLRTPAGKAQQEVKVDGEQLTTSAKPGAKTLPQSRSALVICALTAFRFSTGFESGTWLPYLLAKEGEELWGDNQALFMSVAKLIYGMVILLNPLFGLLSDRLAMHSHALTRRLFVRAGIIFTAAGIFICHWAAPRGHFWVFGYGVFIWRLGQGLNDVTVEAICPEVLPPEQFQLASSIKALMFLLGALSGYALLLGLDRVHYCWLYHGYLIAMFICGIPSLLFINRDMPNAMSKSASRGKRSLILSCADAYINPTMYQGGFPTLCFCVFLFGCGSSPMFYFCLLIRDLARITDTVALQFHFSMSSILFFLTAAIASVLNAWASPKKGTPAGQDNPQDSASGPSGGARPSGERSAASFKMMAAALFCFGIGVFLLPFVHYFNSEAARLAAFYIIAASMGFCFGVAYARFQDCAWQILPRSVDTANAMGFFLLARLIGGALGNFVAGLVLDVLNHSGGADADLQPTAVATSDAMASYRPMGYIALCTGCTLLAFVSGAITLSLPMRFFAAERKRRRSAAEAEAAVPRPPLR